MKPQRRHPLLLPTFWEAAVIRSARAATKTFPTAQMPLTAEGRRRVERHSRRRSPRRAWPRAGPVTPSPLRSYAPAVKEMSAADDAPVLSRSPLRVSAERLVRFGDGLSRTLREVRSTGPFMPALRRGTKGGDLCFPIGSCEGTLGSAPFRRLAQLVGFGNRGRGTARCLTQRSFPWVNGHRSAV
jgi:hypothetical protein